MPTPRITSRTSILMKDVRIYADDRQAPKRAPMNWLTWPWAREVDFAVYVHEVFKPNAGTTLKLGARFEIGIGDTIGLHMQKPFSTPLQLEQVRTRIREGVGFYADGATPPADGVEFGTIATHALVAPVLVSRTLIMGQPEAAVTFSFEASNQDAYARVTVLAHGRA